MTPNDTDHAAALGEAKTWAWTPAGQPGHASVFHNLAGFVPEAALPQPPRDVCEIELVGRHLSVKAPERGTLVTSLVNRHTETSVEIARASGEHGTGDGNIIWGHYAMWVDLLGETITQERIPAGRDRWQMQAHSTAGRTWVWKPVGRVFADRMVLTRVDDDVPLVTYLMRPVPGRPRSGGELPTLSWETSATPAELLLVLLWTFTPSYLGVLPKVQRVASLNFL